VPRGRVELYGYEGSSLLVAQKGKRWTSRGTGSLNIYSRLDLPNELSNIVISNLLNGYFWESKFGLTVSDHVLLF
jgi:hypothetical protein